MLAGATKHFLGYDLFVSYSRQDTQYADSLVASLQTRGLTCFVDREDIAGTDDLDPSLAKAVLRSRVLLLLASESAARSPHVAREIELATGNGKTIVPIDLDGTMSRRRPWPQLEDAIWIEEDAAAAEGEGPSENVLADIERRFRLLRRRRMMRLIMGAVIAGLLALSIWALFERSIARERQAEAERQTELANEATGLARCAENKEREQRKRAEEATRQRERETRVTAAHLLAQQGRAEFEEQPLRALALARDGWRRAAREKADSAAELASVMADLARLGRLRKLGADVLDVHPILDGEYVALQTRLRPSEIRRSRDLEVVKELGGALTGPPRSPRTDEAFLLFEVESRGARGYELRRTGSLEIVGVGAKRLQLIPASFPRLGIFDNERSEKRLFRLDTNEELGREGLDTHPLYRPGWPFVVVAYTDDFRGKSIQDGDLLEVPSGDRREILPERIETLVAPAHSDEPHFVFVLRGGKQRLARSDRARPFGGSVALDDLDRRVTLVSSSGDTAASRVLIADERSTTLVNARTGSGLDQHSPAIVEAEALTDRLAWRVRYKDGRRAILEAKADRLEETAQQEPVPATTEAGPGRRSAERQRREFDCTQSVCWERIDNEDGRRKKFIKTVFWRSDDPATAQIYESSRAAEVDWARLAPPGEATHLLFEWKGRRDDEFDEPNTTLVRLSDGQKITQRTGRIEFEFLSPAPYYTLVEERSLHRLSDGAEVARFDDEISALDLSQIPQESFFVVRFVSGRSQIWQAAPAPRPVLDLGVGLQGYHVPHRGRPWIIWYQGGSAYEVSPGWLASLGKPAAKTDPAQLAKRIDDLFELAPWATHP